VIVDQPGQDAPALEIDVARVRTRRRHDRVVAANGGEYAVADRHGVGDGIAAIKRRETTVPQDKVCTHRRASLLLNRGTGLAGDHALHRPSNVNDGGSMFSSNAFAETANPLRASALSNRSIVKSSITASAAATPPLPHVFSSAHTAP
jgi:hypothetical protein